MTQPARSIWRALTAFLILPGAVACIVPWLLRPAHSRFHIAGLPLLVIGTLLLLWCVRDFYVTGGGSLAPWAPPAHLVRVGLYGISRNPMYIAVLLILAGWAVAFATRTLWIYAGCVAIAFHLRVVLSEEPYLAATFGSAWTDGVSRAGTALATSSCTLSGDSQMELMVQVPGRIHSVDCGDRVADPLDAALRAASLGELRNEGTQMGILDGRYVVAGR